MDSFAFSTTDAAEIVVHWVLKKCNLNWDRFQLEAAGAIATCVRSHGLILSSQIYSATEM